MSCQNSVRKKPHGSDLLAEVISWRLAQKYNAIRFFQIQKREIAFGPEPLQAQAFMET